MLAGYTGTCKSFTALSWAASVATGAPWHYRQACVTGTALYVAAEGASGINSRLSAWESHNGTKVLDNALITLPNPINLGRLADVAELCSIVDEQKVLFVVIDTLNRCAVGLDENSAKDMGVVVDSLYAIQQCTSEHRGTVLLVHHTGKDKATIRGSSALEAGVDTVYAADGNPRAVRLYRTKRKDGPADDVLTLRLDKVANSAVLVHALADMTANEDQLMSAFLSIFGTTGASKAELRSACEIPPASFHRALNELVKRGVLLNTGTDKRPFYIAGVLP